VLRGSGLVLAPSLWLEAWGMVVTEVDERLTRSPSCLQICVTAWPPWLEKCLRPSVCALLSTHILAGLLERHTCCRQ
jgi:hypothetical protein